jgi:ceramide glucosyltransferase
VLAFALALAALCGAATVAHLASALVAVARGLNVRRTLGRGALPAVSVVRPACGVDTHERVTLASSFRLDPGRVEILFCCETYEDPAVLEIRRLIREHPEFTARLLVGSDLGSANPKLNNMAKGWWAARHRWVLFADSNLLLPPDYLERLFAAWKHDTGLVCVPPVGLAPVGFPAELECAFLNTFQARWQLAMDAVGLGFAQGKTMLFRHEDLASFGGVSALAAELAEDAAATKLVRAAGRKVSLADPVFGQPLGRRTMAQVLARQLRWAQLRRATFPAYYVPRWSPGRCSRCSPARSRPGSSGVRRASPAPCSWRCGCPPRPRWRGSGGGRSRPGHRSRGSRGTRCSRRSGCTGGRGAPTSGAAPASRSPLTGRRTSPPTRS